MPTVPSPRARGELLPAARKLVHSAVEGTRLMTIGDLEFFVVETPRREHGGSSRSVLLRVVTDSGLAGWGEANLRWQAGELPDRRRRLLPVLAGRSVFDIVELLELEALQPAALRAAVEMACWDLVGQIAELPLFCLLGGQYRHRIPVAVRLEEQSPERLAELAQELFNQGMHWQILSSLGSVDSDLELVARVHQATGGRAEICFDAAESHSMDDARRLCTSLEDGRVRVVLDPLAGGQLDQLVALARQTSVPLAAWRPITEPANLLVLVRARAVALAVVDVQRVGGILRARSCAAIAHAAELPAAVAGCAPGGVATAAILHVAASTPAFLARTEFSSRHLHEDLLTEPLEVVDGMITVPQGAGLGVRVDRAKLEQALGG